MDCYNEAEQITGIFTMLEENLALPFTTTVLGMEVTIDRIEFDRLRQSRGGVLPSRPSAAGSPAGSAATDPKTGRRGVDRRLQTMGAWNVKDIPNDN